MANEYVKAFTDSNFDEEVLKSSQYVLVDFWAAWCGPCKMIAPVVDEIAEEFKGRLSVGKVNVDENKGIASNYGIMSIPTLLLFKDGEIVEKIVGYKSKAELAAIINNFI